jgi:hypothetical protein
MTLSSAGQMTGERPRIDAIDVADDACSWERLGFEVREQAVQLGDVRVRLAGRQAGGGILSWSLRGLAGSSKLIGPELDGLPTYRSDQPRPQPADKHPNGINGMTPQPADKHPNGINGMRPQPAGRHPNGISGIDHIVAMSPQLDRSVEALERAGLDLRRIREQPTPAGAPRQAFFRLGAVILEVVQEPPQAVERSSGPDGPARFWGLALLADDIEQTVSRLGEHVSDLRPAVQPGRLIATLKRSAGLAVPVALMSPPA